MSEQEDRLRRALHDIAALAPTDVRVPAPAPRRRAPALAAAAVVVALLAGGAAAVALPHREEQLSQQPPASAGSTPASPSPRAPDAAHAISATSISSRTGWLLVDGGTCRGTACRRLLRTDDGGRTFSRLALPPVPVTQVRFAGPDDGWAFGQDVPSPGNGLWRTRDGGRSWRRVLAHPVSSLEVARGTVWAVVLSDDGTTPGLYRGDVADDDLQPAAPVPNRSGELAVVGRTAYVLARQGAGPIRSSLVVATAGGSRVRPAPPCPDPQTPALLAAAPGRAVVFCSGGGTVGQQPRSLWSSRDDGRTWLPLPRPPLEQPPSDGAPALAGSAVFLSGPGEALLRLDPDGAWREVLRDGAGAGFTSVGFTDAQHGLATGPSGTWHTEDGGTSWTRLQLP